MDLEYFKKLFDWQFYVSNHKDLQDAKIDSFNKAWHHLNTHAWKETRIPFKDPSVFEQFKQFKTGGNDCNDNNNINTNSKKLVQESGLIFEIKNKRVLVNTHSNLDISAGDTIMISNIINVLLENDNKVTLVSKFPITKNFTRNLIVEDNNNHSSNFTSFTPTDSSDHKIVSSIDEYSNNMDIIFLRNHEILHLLENKNYLFKTIIYGLDIHLEGIKKLNNKFLSVITQSEQLKQKFIEYCGSVDKNKIEVCEPIAYKYNFDIPERTDNEIRLIYCGTLRDEENILEIIDEFQKIHKERPEVLLKIVYGKIHGNPEFTKKVNEYIKNGVSGITFKHNLSHKDACYEIATSDIGICWRKNGWGDNGEVSTKVREYEIYGVSVCNILQNLKVYSNKNLFMNKELTGNNIILLLNNCNDRNNCLYVKSFSNSTKESSLQFLVNNSRLIESEILLSNDYITPNYIDESLFQISNVHIYGEMLSHIIIEEVSSSTIKIDTNYKLESSKQITKYKNNKTILNNIAFIGDEFTFNSLNDIVNITYISKTDVNNIDINLYDMLFCESTWHGIDGTWKYAFNLYTTTKFSIELKYIISEFKKNKKVCIFYNKEDPTNFEKFYNSAELFDIIITTSKSCVEKYKNIYPDKQIINSPFLCNPIIHNPINNKKEGTAFFVGGFYNHLSNRSENTNKLLKQVVSNQINLSIINRHYFFPKLTRQISRFKQHQNKYEISKEFKQFEKPSISHLDALNLYKNSLFHLNINTVTNCKTMSSRRMIELLGCGCNVFSNNSESIEYLNLPVITDLSKCKINIFNEYNVDGFYLTHIKYSYLSLIRNLFDMVNINIKNNVHIKISCKNESKIPEKYKYLLKSEKNDFELLLTNKNEEYYNANIIEKLLVYPSFFNGNVCFTDDKNKYFTVENTLIDNDCIIKYNKDNKKSLFIPKV